MGIIVTDPLELVAKEICFKIVFQSGEDQTDVEALLSGTMNAGRCNAVQMNADKIVVISQLPSLRAAISTETN